jgi:ABC-type multidrug transport system permease subunit
MVFATPTHPLSYAIGVALVPLFLALPGIVLLWGVLLAQGAVDTAFIVISVPVLALTWLSTVAFGSTLSWRLKLISPYRLEYLATLLALLFVFLPPVYYPATNLGSFAWLSYLAPTSSAASLLLASARMDGGMSVVVNWLALVGWTSLGLGIFIRSVHWQET